jgi:hypothetical protein
MDRMRINGECQYVWTQQYSYWEERPDDMQFQCRGPPSMSAVLSISLVLSMSSVLSMSPTLLCHNSPVSPTSSVYFINMNFRCLFFTSFEGHNLDVHVNESDKHCRR